MAISALVTVRPERPPHHGAALPAVAGLLACDHLGPPGAAALLGHAVRAAKTDRRRRHALVADRPAAVGAAHAGLAVGVTVAVLDVQIVRHVQFEVLDGWGGAHDGGRHSCARATSSAIQPSMRTGLMVSRATTAWRVAPLAISAPSAAPVGRAVFDDATHLVAKAERGAADVVGPHGDVEQVVDVRRAVVGAGRAHGRQGHAAALDLGDRHADGAQRLDARDLEVDEIVGVVDHAGGVGLLVADSDAGVERPRGRQRRVHGGEV